MSIKGYSRALSVFLAGLSLVGLGLVQPSSATATFAASDVQLCPSDRPCIRELYQQGNIIHLSWDPHRSYDGYNVLWSRPGRRGQFHVGGTSATFRTPNRDMSYTFNVQGCDTHFLAPSTCSPWSYDGRITTKP